MASLVETFKQGGRFVTEGVKFAQMVSGFGSGVNKEALDFNELITGSNSRSGSSSNILVSGGLILIVAGGAGYWAYNNVDSVKEQVDNLWKQVKSYLPSSDTGTDGGTDGGTI